MRKGRSSQGFSLVEMMIAMLLVFLLLGLVATLMREYSRVARHTAARENTMDGVQTALSAVAQEFSGAQTVFSPAAGTASVVAFWRVNPLAKRFPTQEEYPFVWEPDSSLMNVVYELTNRQLVRASYAYDTAASQTHVMASDVEGFQATALSPSQYELSLSFQETLRLKTFRTRVRVWYGQ